MVVDQVTVDRAQEIGVQRPILIEETEHFAEDKFSFRVKVVAPLRRLTSLAVEVWIISFVKATNIRNHIQIMSNEGPSDLET